MSKQEYPQGFELVPFEITLSPTYNMSIDGRVKRCDVFHSGRRVGWIAYFKDEDRISYFNDNVMILEHMKQAVEMFKNQLIEEVLLE